MFIVIIIKYMLPLIFFSHNVENVGKRAVGTCRKRTALYNR